MRPHRLMPTNVCILALCYYIHILSVHFISVCCSPTCMSYSIFSPPFTLTFCFHITLKTYYMLPFFCSDPGLPRGNDTIEPRPTPACSFKILGSPGATPSKVSRANIGLANFLDCDGHCSRCFLRGDPETPPLFS